MSFKYDLTQLQSRDQLIRFLGLDEQLFENVLAFKPSAKNISQLSDAEILVVESSLFHRHKIPKKNPRRGYRIVWEPLLLQNHYKALTRRLNNFFAHKLEGFPHARTFGYVGGRNIRENARDHCGHKYLISLDLRDFFPSITAARISTFLRSTGITPTVADLLSGFVTIEGALPLGLSTSPTIANAICLPMDMDLEALALKCGSTFSRYADDITFSADGVLPAKEDLAACVQRYGFEIAESKTRTSKLGQAHYVTGLSVSDPAQPHVPRQKKRRLRQELYYARKYGLDDHFHHLGINSPQIIQHEVNRLDGLVKFTAYHEPRLSGYLKSEWLDILEASDHRPSFKPKNQDRAPFYIYVDEAEFDRSNGDHLLALAMAVSQHQDQVNQATQETLDAVLADVWAAGNRKAIIKNGMHFSDATEDMRLTYVERMRLLPFEGYVAITRLPAAASYEATYLRLLGAMIKRRLMAAESRFAHLVFEQNDKVRHDAIRAVIEEAYESLAASNNRRPEVYEVGFVSKPNLGMSVPDFLLGTLRDYLMSGSRREDGRSDRRKLLFERIRDKYRLILDVDEWIEYSRRRQILPW